MLATGCVRYENIGRALSVEVIVLVAASIALGRALEETGAAAWMASILALGLGRCCARIRRGGSDGVRDGFDQLRVQHRRGRDHARRWR